MEAAAAAGLRGTILIKRRAFGAKRGGLGVVGERGGWGGGGCVQRRKMWRGFGVSGRAAVVGADGDFMVGAAMGTRFVLPSRKRELKPRRPKHVLRWIDNKIRSDCALDPCDVEEISKSNQVDHPENFLDEIMNKVAEMSGKYAKEVKVVISPYGICPLGAHIDHQFMSPHSYSLKYPHSKITDFGISAGFREFKGNGSWLVAKSYNSWKEHLFVSSMVPMVQYHSSTCACDDT
ncbi:hypothetical protein Syun_030225 [Stephania yunnanensis]|uniref:Uncharacterized protein n=1 Tax=Stephania yunnanensis TaxID=152371 RepID=A0AAP0E739_9MAGN